MIHGTIQSLREGDRAGEPAEGVEAMYDDIEMESDYVRILAKYLSPAVTVIATVAGAAATIYGLLNH